jgi:predicted ribosome quality control (RQC) complex YloA/Tae2 family protein
LERSHPLEHSHPWLRFTAILIRNICVNFSAMDDESIKLIVDEITPLLTGRAPGKIFQFSPTSLAIDFGLRDAGYLFISVEPAAPRLHLIKRRVRDLEKQSSPLTTFALGLRKELSNTRIASVEKESNDRVVWFAFAGEDDLGTPRKRALVAQLTGRSANLLLLDEHHAIIHTMRSSPAGRIGDVYEKSEGQPGSAKRETDLGSLIKSGDSSPSETADRYFTSLGAEKLQAARIGSARADLRRKMSQQERLLTQLQNDLSEHENPEEHKRLGDLLLANLTTAKRDGNRVVLIDYFAEDAPPLDVEIEATVSLPEEAARRFARYARSKRAIEQINKRMQAARSRLGELDSEQQSLERRIAAGEFPAPANEATGSNAKPATETRREKERKRVPGTRQYLSGDGFEILVGRTANDNDQLTFKIARPNDLWLHAADYGGSHVVVRNSTRKEIPQRTLIEAAQLAAYFSQAKKNPKADVHYTERKFVSKIKGGKPGLVRLQRFKNLTVAPKEAATRL